MLKSPDRITADKYFGKTEDKLNCAQAVLKAFQNEFLITEEEIKEFGNYGRGKADNGLCGAIYATNYLMQKKNDKLVLKEFENKLGAIQCKTLKEMKLSCLDILKISDKIIEDNL